eukprot:3279420-Amphidinium_carterae.1
MELSAVGTGCKIVNAWHRCCSGDCSPVVCTTQRLEATSYTMGTPFWGCGLCSSFLEECRCAGVCGLVRIGFAMAYYDDFMQIELSLTSSGGGLRPVRLYLRLRDGYWGSWHHGARCAAGVFPRHHREQQEHLG